MRLSTDNLDRFEKDFQKLNPATLNLLRGGSVLFDAGNFNASGVIFTYDGGADSRSAATRTLVGWAQTGSLPTGLAVSPDGIRVYVLLTSGNVMWMFLPSATGGIG